MEYILVRPVINWKSVFIKISLGLITCFACAFLVCKIIDYYGIEDQVFNILKPVNYILTINIKTLYGRVAAAIFLLELFVFRKNVAIFMVRMYQKFAPESIRDKCLFEPCCSNYMIMAIEKYGFFKGVYKGMKRIRRCRLPNGGIDYP